jgi:hypothetical protein
VAGWLDPSVPAGDLLRPCREGMLNVEKVN